MLNSSQNSRRVREEKMDSRIGADGKPISSLPKTRLGPDGKPISSQHKTKMGPDGKPISSQSKTKMGPDGKPIKRFEPKNRIGINGEPVGPGVYDSDIPGTCNLFQVFIKQSF